MSANAPSFPLALSFNGCPQRPIGPNWGGGGPRRPRTPKFAEGKTPGRSPATGGNPQTPTIPAVLGRPRNPRGKTADTHVSRRKKSAAAANPQPPADGNGEASCATAYRTLGLQRRESAEGPRPRCPSFFRSPRLSEAWREIIGGGAHREWVPDRGVAEARRRRGVRPFSARSPGLMLFMGVRRSHRWQLPGRWGKERRKRVQ